MFTLGIIVIIALIITLTILTETNNGGVGFWILFIVAVTCDYWAFKDCLNPIRLYVFHNPGVIIFGVGSYLILGVLWSFFRWYIYLLDYKKKQGNSIDKSFINPSNNKSRLITWMSYWPLSLAWFIVNKPFTRLYNWIFEKVSSTYQKISDKVFKVQ